MTDSTHTQVLAAGAIAAFTIDLLVYPLDTIKTRYQSQDYLKTFASSASGKSTSTGIFRGLYQGVGSVLIATLPAAGIFFTTYESAKIFYANALPSGVPQPVVHSLASGTAELASCVVLTPAEVIKQNAQMLRARGSHGGGRSTSLEALHMLWRDGNGNGGPARRLWTGYTALAVRNLPFTAIQFPLFESIRKRIWGWRDRRRQQLDGADGAMEGFGGSGGSSMIRSRARQDGEVLQEKIQAGRANAGVASAAILLETGLVTGASAGLSGAFAAVLTTPTDVVKTRMMLSAGGNESGTQERSGQGQPRRISGLQIAGQVLRERGVKGLFRGGAFRAVWTALGSGLYLGTYEVAKLWLKGGGDGRDNDDL